MSSEKQQALVDGGLFDNNDENADATTTTREPDTTTNTSSPRLSGRTSPTASRGRVIASPPPERQTTRPGAVHMSGAPAGQDNQATGVSNENVAPPSSNASNSSSPPAAVAVDSAPVEAHVVNEDDEDQMKQELEELRARNLQHERMLQTAVLAEVVDEETGVKDAVPHTQEQEDSSTNNQCCSQVQCTRKRLAILVGVLVLLVAIAVGAVVATSQRSSAGSSEPAQSSPAPTAPPTSLSPTLAPTTTPSPTTAVPPPQDLIDFLASISTDGGAALQTLGTPQNEALQWLANNANLSLYTEHEMAQRYGLATLYLSTGGQNWTSNNHWLDHGAECGRWWQDSLYSQGRSGVLNCTDEGAVVSLFLSWNGLRGVIPPEIAFFSDSLVSLDLGYNQLEQNIPTEVSLLTNLESLILHVNYLNGTIPSQVGALTRLTNLELSGNLLNGTLPVELWSLTDLVTLELWDNGLMGSISSDIGALTSLTFLNLRTNSLEGTIPTAIHTMTNLDTLLLYGNNLTGSFTCPEFIGNCRISCNDANDTCRSLQ